jgi:outer membrane lipoprotein-sorting protein
MKKSSILIILVIFSASLIQAQTADEILARYFETTGGIENWKKLNTMRIDGKMSMQGMVFNFTIQSKRPNKRKVVVDAQGTKIIQAFDGIDAWMINPLAGGSEPAKMPDELAKEFTTQKFEPDFVDYKKKGHQVTLLGEEEVDGVVCFKIQLIKNIDQEEITELHFFDMKFFVPIMVINNPVSGTMKGQEVKTYLSDYKEIDGMKMPTLMEAKVNGQSIRKLTFEKIVLNGEIDDSSFTFPKK